MADTAVAAFRRHAVERAERKRSDITVAAVARQASVSREFIYSHTELHQAIRTAARQIRAGTPTNRAGETSTAFRAERTTLLAQIQKHRATITALHTRVEQLDNQRRRWLGSQLTDLIIDPDTHAAVRRDNDRLTSQNTTLQQQLAAAHGAVEQLERELAASRRAHAEDVAALAADPHVSALPGHRKP